MVFLGSLWVDSCKDTAQLLFIWGDNPAFEVTEELISMSSFHCKTIGKNIFQRNWDNTNSVQSEGESSKMCSKWW